MPHLKAVRTLPGPLCTGASPSDPSLDLFYLHLRYYHRNPKIDMQGAPGYYKNGNIATVTWQTPYKDRSIYNIAYDKLDRLTWARFANYRKPAFEPPFYYNFDAYNEEVPAYDGIGNILRLKRNGPFLECDVEGELAFSYDIIDDLAYYYSGSGCGVPGERLLEVHDETLGPAAPKGFSIPIAPYCYDDNGNMTTDGEAGVTIWYNHLNLPRKATNGQHTVEWYYDATGRKLRKQGGGQNVTYAGDFEKHDNGSRFINHPEGRWAFIVDPENPLDWHNQFAIRDHLGNTRVVFADLNDDQFIQVRSDEWSEFPLPDDYTEILQENHYYPFGLNMEGRWYPPEVEAWENPYQYNGKEKDKDLGLDWYHYGARMYEPVIGRFTGVDPIADEFAFQSNYAYGANNPISNIDIFGLAAASTQELIDKAWAQGEGTYDNDGNRISENNKDQSDSEEDCCLGAEKYIDYLNSPAHVQKSKEERIQDVTDAGELQVDMLMGVESVVFSEVAFARGLYWVSKSKWLRALRGGSGAAKGGTKLLTQFSSSTIEDAVKLVMKDPNKVAHLFPAKHNLGSLVNKLGGQENTVRAVLNQANGKLPESGVFNNIPVNVGGSTVFIRGNVINGVPRLGTMFIP